MPLSSALNVTVFVESQGHLTPDLSTLVCKVNIAEAKIDFRLQYVVWLKISRNETRQREFVYEYDTCTGADRAYGSLEGRAKMTMVTKTFTVGL